MREWYNREVFSKIERAYREEHAMEHVDFLYDCFIDVVRKWQREGKMRSDLDAEMIMAIFGALVNLDLHKEELGLQYFPRLQELMSEFVMNGVNGCPGAPPPEVVRMVREAAEAATACMGTVVTHRVYGAHAEVALRAAGAETLRLEGLLSRFLPDSDISRVAAAAGREVVSISDETFEVLSLSCDIARLSHGAFDPTVAPLVSLWHVLSRTTAPPDKFEIRKVLRLVDYAGLTLDPVRKTAALRKKGQSLDLGGIGKGYASDRIVDVFRRHGVTSAFTNFGGNVATLGTKPDGSPWRVGIRHPRRSGALAGVLDIADRAVVTSGDDQRYFIGADGRRYHHLLDPRTGYPSESGLLSATVVAGSAAEADALSTALFVAGAEKGLKVLKYFPGAGAVLIGDDLTVAVTSGLLGAFKAEDGLAVRTIEC